MPQNHGPSVTDPGDRESDDALEIRRASRGDHQAFRSIYLRHVGMVQTLASRLCRDPDRCDDLVQESFIALWAALPRFRGDSRLATYCHRIASRTIWQHIRRDRDDLWLDESHVASAEDLGEAIAVHIDLNDAVSRLPDGARTILILREVEGLSLQEIADQLDRSIGTVKSQLHRARALLTRALR